MEGEVGDKRQTHLARKNFPGRRHIDSRLTPNITVNQTTPSPMQDKLAGTDHASPAQGSATLPSPIQRTRMGKEKNSAPGPGPGPVRSHRVKKLVPPRPFPTVPPGVSATGPRSAHHEGKNRITVTRKTKLGPYLRRCKDIILKDGYVLPNITTRHATLLNETDVFLTDTNPSI